MLPVISQHIEMVPSVNHGEKAVIAGTRIRVVDIYAWHELQGRSAHDIVGDFPQLTLADVHAALAYYWDNEELIQSQMRRAEEVVEELKNQYPPKFSKSAPQENVGDDQVSPG